jgi:HTH-type transcriptional regulator / antitoxin HigA
MKTRARTKPFAAFPRDYAGLLRMHMLRPIHDRADLDNATEVIDAMAGHDLTEDQEDYLDALSSLVMVYEAEHFPFEPKQMEPRRILQFLIDQSGMSASDLGELLGNRSLGSKLLRGERELSKTHIKTLSEHFKVRADLFLG